MGGDQLSPNLNNAGGVGDAWEKLRAQEEWELSPFDRKKKKGYARTRIGTLNTGTSKGM